MTARDELLARFRSEAGGPPNGTELALRCSAHGTFILWTSPPLPTVPVACPPECKADPDDTHHDEPQLTAIQRERLAAVLLDHQRTEINTG